METIILQGNMIIGALFILLASLYVWVLAILWLLELIKQATRTTRVLWMVTISYKSMDNREKAIHEALYDSILHWDKENLSKYFPVYTQKWVKIGNTEYVRKDK